MNQQPSTFFVLLTSQDRAGGGLLVNIADIMYVLPDGGGGAIYVRDGDDALLCKEHPYEVAALIKRAMIGYISGLAREAIRIAQE